MISVDRHFSPVMDFSSLCDDQQGRNVPSTWAVSCVLLLNVDSYAPNYSANCREVTLYDLDSFDLNDVNYYGAPFTKPTDKVCASPFYNAKDSTFLEMTGITNSSKQHNLHIIDVSM